MPTFTELCAPRGPLPDAPEGVRGFVAEATEDWGQGRALFGGAMAAMGLAALDGAVPEGRPLRSFLAQFVAPVAPGPVEVRARVLRSGRSMTQGSVELVQDGATCFTLAAAYGAPRVSPLAVRPPAGPVEGAPVAGGEVFRGVPGITPVFVSRFEYVYVGDSFPFSGASEARVGGWVRFGVPAPVGAGAIAALVDAWPAPVLPLFTRPAPASTVTWALDFVTPPPPEGWSGEAWWRFEGDTVGAGDGYAVVGGRLWGVDGQLVAVSRQLVAEFS